MPRLSPRLLRSVSQNVRLLLPANHGNIADAKAELRWIREIKKTPRQVQLACRQRHRFVPLQYILKSQPFGALDLACESGVLIPRWETEQWSMELGRRINLLNRDVKVVDVCTGSGCIALNLANVCPRATVIGLDVSMRAIRLAEKNAKRNQQLLHSNVRFQQVDVFDAAMLKYIQDADVISMNPPYIRMSEMQSISLSARRYEPWNALLADKVDTDDADRFYARVVSLLTRTSVKMLAFEVGSAAQATRVKECIEGSSQWAAEIWIDAAGRDRCVFALKA